MIQLDTICNVGKSLTAKATKDESGAPTTVAQMKFSDLQVDRDTVDELLGETIGWCRTALYDEQGAPRKRYGITVYGRQLRVSGVITGPKAKPTLALLQAELTDTYLTLIPLGAMLEGKLTWSARRRGPGRERLAWSYVYGEMGDHGRRTGRYVLADECGVRKGDDGDAADHRRAWA